MRRAGRIALAVVGLAAVGALMGAVSGIVTAEAFLAAKGDVHLLLDRTVWGMAAAIGGVCGVVLAPLTSFTILRHVPLWRVFAETTAGTILGACLAMLITRDLDLNVVVSAAALGFVAAGARLAWRARRARREQTARLPDDSLATTGR